MLQGGQVVAGRYRVEKRIAQGGMGAIFAAEHLATEERVALKVLWPHVLGSREAVESFQREARLNARINSDHIVRILDAGLDEALGMPFLAMELLRGMTLRALVDGAGPLAPAEALLVLRHVAKALDKAHGHLDRQGRPAPVVHRDLKPENLFIALREEGEAVVKVLDFGIAKVLSESHQVSQELRGTPLFMAREQFTREPVTPQLDLWALGLIAFYLLAGRVYWLSGAQGPEGVAQLLNEILVEPLSPPSQRALAFGLAPEWPAGFDAWFLRCLERDPRARFASAGATVEALTEAFTTGAGLAETAIAAAIPSLARKVALGLESPRGAAAPGAMTTLPPASVTLSVKTDELLPGTLSELLTVPPSSVTAGAVPRAPAGAASRAPSRREFTKAWALGGGGILGIALAVGVVVAKRSARQSELGIASAKASPVESVSSGVPLSPALSASTTADAPGVPIFSAGPVTSVAPAASLAPATPSSAEAAASTRSPALSAPNPPRQPQRIGAPPKRVKPSEEKPKAGGADPRNQPQGDQPPRSQPPPKDPFRER